MEKELLEKLLQINDEEKYLTCADSEPRDIYAKSSRFIIERRHLSSIGGKNPTSPIILRTHPRFCEFPAHTHDFIEFMYVANGKITHTLDSQKITLYEGDVIIFGKNTKHGILSAEKEDIGINIIVSTDLFEGLLGELRHSEQMPERLFEPLLTETENLYRIFHASGNLLVENLMENKIRSIFELQKMGAFLLRQSLLLLMGYLADIPDAKTEISDFADRTEMIKRQIVDYIRTSYNSATLTGPAQMLSFPLLTFPVDKEFRCHLQRPAYRREIPGCLSDAQHIRKNRRDYRKDGIREQLIFS